MDLVRFSAVFATLVRFSAVFAAAESTLIDFGSRVPDSKYHMQVKLKHLNDKYNFLQCNNVLSMNTHPSFSNKKAQILPISHGLD